MLGYVARRGATAEKMRGEWFLTGDQGQMDDDRRHLVTSAARTT